MDSLMIIPTLCVVMPYVTLRVHHRGRGASKAALPTQGVGTIIANAVITEQNRLISTIRLPPLSFSPPHSYNRPLSSLPRPLRP